MKRLAFTLFGVSTAMIVAALVLLALSIGAQGTGFGYRGWSSAFAISFVVVGAVVASNRGTNAIGWVFSVLGVAASLLALADEFGFYGIERGVAAGVWGAWLGEWLWVPLIAGVFVLVPLVFPDGRLLSRKWRAVIVLVSIASVIGSTHLAFVPGPLDQSPRYINPVGMSFAKSSIVKTLGDIGLSVLMLSMALGAASVIVRFRNSRGNERQQIKWLAFSVAIAAVAFVAYLPFGVTGTIPPKALEGVMTSSIVAVPVCIGIAVMRYRLYDIDRIISRTLSYAAVTSILGGIFALVILVPTLIVGGGGETPDYQIAIGTLLAAALFRPVLRRVQSAVDHRFNRKRYDAEQTVSAFTARLREQLDIDALGAELQAVVNETVRPERVSLWLVMKS